jgi:hypothetical protein
LQKLATLLPTELIQGWRFAYSILFDDGGFLIQIGVPAEASREQLRATLSRAADDHQDDPHRDYLWVEYLFVTAYLVEDARTSGKPAGDIKRYVPPIHPDALPYKRKERDSFLITLEEARISLP